eukprot:518448-Rhodomonas_salina.2
MQQQCQHSHQGKKQARLPEITFVTAAQNIDKPIGTSADAASQAPCEGEDGYDDCAKCGDDQNAKDIPTTAAELCTFYKDLLACTPKACCSELYFESGTEDRTNLMDNSQTRLARSSVVLPCTSKRQSLSWLSRWLQLARTSSKL